MSNELKEEILHLDGNLYFHANHWGDMFPSEISICRESQYDNQDDIDIDITKEQAVMVVSFLRKHYKLENKEK